MKSDLASVVEDDPAEVVASADGASPPAVATLLPDEQLKADGCQAAESSSKLADFLLLCSMDGEALFYYAF